MYRHWLIWMEQTCKILKVTRPAYYKWLNGSKSVRKTENIGISDIDEKIHTKILNKG